jgi:phage terminase large subunit-like protein
MQKKSPDSNVVQLPRPPRTETRGERNIRWIEGNLCVPEGRDVGQKMVLRQWQKDDIKAIYDNPDGTRRAILSFGRKNGKTTFAAMLVLLHLCGPESKNAINSQLFSAAQSRDQASIVFNLAAKMIRMSEKLTYFVQIRDTRKELYCKDRGTTYRALSAEASTAYGLSPKFIIHDELGQVRGPTSQLYEALETATAAQRDPLSIIISTQSPNDGDLLSTLIDDALSKHDSRTIVKLYTVPLTDDPFIEASIRLANPAFGDFQAAAEILAMAEDARRMPARENEYRNLILNQRVEAQTPFIARGTWEACASPPLPFDDDTEIFGGLDLSAVADLTAFVQIGQINGIWHVYPTFWLPEEGLHERGRNDRVPYPTWVKSGHLITVPGSSIEYEYVAGYIAETISKHNFKAVAFDKWNYKAFRPWLVRSGLSDATIDNTFIEAGQGFQWMSPALRQLESAILNHKIAHGNHPVLNWNAMNSVVVSDPAGNRKLAKNRSVGRIDGMVALAMAFGIGAGISAKDAEREPTYQMFVVA